VNNANNSLFEAASPASTPPDAKTALKDICCLFRQEHAAFVVICIYLIFEYNKPHLIYPALDIIPWGKTLLLLAICFAYSDKTSRRPPKAAVWPVLIFSVIVLISMASAFSISTAVKEWAMFFGWALLVLLITCVVNTRQRLFLFMAVYFLSNLKMAQHGFRSWAKNGFGFAGWGVGGSPGWFQNSGEFSLEMVVVLPLVLSYIVMFHHDWSRSVRFLFYFFAVMVVGSIIASGSRGGILGLVSLALWGLVYSRQRFKALVIIAVIAALVYQVMPPEFLARFETAGEDTTSISRLAYWKVGIQTIKDNPITGIGFRNWQIWVAANHPELIELVRGRVTPEVIHNTYLEAGTELGLLGVAAYFGILMQIYFTNRKTARLTYLKNERFFTATAIGLNGSLFGYLAPSYFMAVLYYPYVWILLALSISVATISRNNTSHN